MTNHVYRGNEQEDHREITERTAPTFSILIPTIGRASLSSILAEIRPQLHSLDEVLVIGDGRQRDAERIASQFGPQIRYYEFGPTKLWGHPQRNWGMSQCSGSHILSYDDDDAVVPDALSIIRATSVEFPKRPIIFRMKHADSVLWKDRTLRNGNVSTQMLVIPNIPPKLGKWGGRYAGDYDFIMSTVAKYDEGISAVVWKEEVIALHGMNGVDPRPSRSDQ